MGTHEEFSPVRANRPYTVTRDQQVEMARQIGGLNLLSISGGRVLGIIDGIELPVSNGYRVRVQLTPADTYTVSRVFTRGGKEWVKGVRQDVYCDEVGQAAYYAGMFRSYDENEWVTLR